MARRFRPLTLVSALTLARVFASALVLLALQRAWLLVVAECAAAPAVAASLPTGR